MTHAVQFEALNRTFEAPNLAQETPCLKVENLNLYYAEKQALNDINITIPKKRVSAFIGPSGCGKSTLLRCFNRMNDLIDILRIEGLITLEGEDIYSKSINVADLRRRVGMVFQKPNPFPKTIYENVAYGLRIQGINSRRKLDEAIEMALKGAALWDEVKDRLHDSAMGLSGGQQQRTALARALVKQVSIYLLVEPGRDLDAQGDAALLASLARLKGKSTVIMVTQRPSHMRLADRVVVVDQGLIVAQGPPDKVLAGQNKLPKTG